MTLMSCNDGLQTRDVDQLNLFSVETIFRRQIMTSKVDHHTERIKYL